MTFNRKRLFFSVSNTDEGEPEIEKVEEEKNAEYIKSLKEKVLEKIKLRNLERMQARRNDNLPNRKALIVETVERVDEVQQKKKARKKIKRRKSGDIGNEANFSSPYVESSNISYVVDSLEDD